MRRREFITLVGGAAAAWPLTAQAQQGTLPVIGFMSSRSPEDSQSVLAAFRKGLSESGLVEGKNFVVEFRWARGDFGRLSAFAAELVNKSGSGNCGGRRQCFGAGGKGRDFNHTDCVWQW